jgi:hypothetical protein
MPSVVVSGMSDGDEKRPSKEVQRYKPPMVKRTIAKKVVQFTIRPAKNNPRYSHHFIKAWREFDTTSELDKHGSSGFLGPEFPVRFCKKPVGNVFHSDISRVVCVHYTAAEDTREGWYEGEITKRGRGGRTVDPYAKR